MSDEVKDSTFKCPKCGRPMEPDWSVCPQCGLRLKLDGNLVLRGLMWSVILFGFIRTYFALMKSDQTSANTFLVIFGIPLAYVFGKAVIFRLRGEPLTYSQIGSTGLRALLYTWGITIVVPIVLGLALFLLLFAVCLMSAGAPGGGPH